MLLEEDLLEDEEDFDVLELGEVDDEGRLGIPLGLGVPLLEEELLGRLGGEGKPGGGVMGAQPLINITGKKNPKNCLGFLGTDLR